MKRTLMLCAFAAVVATASAIDFEAPKYNGSAGGTVLTGQNGWYVPPVGGADWNVFTYAGNTHGIVSNPTGGDQLAVGVTGATPARAQRDHDWASGPVWTASYDILGMYVGQLPTADNLGSFSLQDSATTKSFIALNRWMDPTTATAWQAEYNVYDSTGLALANQSAGAEWMNLDVNKWYRQSTTFSFADNTISEVSITDIVAGTTTTVNPVGWYLQGGSSSGLPTPTAFRFFAGGAAGNLMGIDNITLEVVPEPATVLALGLGVALLAARRRKN